MSAEAMVWALRSKVKSPAERLVLLMMADNINCDGVSTLSNEWLMEVCCLSQGDLTETLTGLQGDGHIKRKPATGWALLIPEEF